MLPVYVGSVKPANLSWQTRIGKLKVVCVNGIETVGKHVSI